MKKRGGATLKKKRGSFALVKRRGGFTLIELALSLVFIGILSVTVVLLIQNTTASYRRGLILNQINTVGMDLTDDMRSSVQYATSDPVTRMCGLYYDKYTNPTNYNNCINDNAMSFTMITKTATVTTNGETLNNIPIYGAFCTGTYTYVWNSGYLFEAEGVSRTVSDVQNLADARVKIEAAANNATTEYQDFRLLKLYDSERSICVNAMNDANASITGGYLKHKDIENNRIKRTFKTSAGSAEDESKDEVLEMLDKTEMSDLVLYDLYVAKPAISSTRENMFYPISFILGTRRGGINITVTGDSCKPPSNENSILDYCAINKFNFAAMAGGN